MVIDRFYFSNGEECGSLEEFLGKLKEIDDECFFSHANEKKNDFANWIEFCVKQKVLANKIRKLKSRDEVIEVIEKKINTPAMKKKGIIDQIKHAILDN